MAFEVGDIVTISYMDGTVDAKVLAVDPVGTYGTHHGWLLVEQITDYEDEPADRRPTYEASVKFTVPQGQPPARSPFSRLALG